MKTMIAYGGIVMTNKRIALYALVIVLSLGIDWATRQTSGYKARQSTAVANEYHHEAIYIADIDPVIDRSGQLKDVRFTSFWPGDSTGSGNRTASGLSAYDFEINDQGWYLYDGKVVVATATEECLESNSGACRKYSQLPEGYQLHRLLDELTLIINGQEYPAIVLDHCGASFWDEANQRYDVFVVDEDHVLDTSGKVLTP